MLLELAVSILNYIRSNGGYCKVYPAPFTVKLNSEDNANIVEPDISIICDQNKLTDNGCIGAPDWIIEVVSSNSSYEHVTKLNKYMKAGVLEYWIVNYCTESVITYNFKSTDYSPKLFTFKDSIKVNTFKELVISLREHPKVCVNLRTDVK